MKKIYSFLIIILVSLLFTSCYSWFENKVDMDIDTPKINLGDLFYKETEITTLAAPTQVIVSKGKYSGTVKIHWDEVPYATSYRLERAVIEPDSSTGEYNVPDEGDFEVVSKYVYSNTYSDIILANPDYTNKEYSNIYYYRISAENIKQGLESSEFTETTDNSFGWLLPPPASIDATKGEDPDFIEISWKSVPQANGYIIYRGEKESGYGMEYIASVTGNMLAYKDRLTSNEKGQEFYYKVCAVLADGSQSAFTGLALGYSAKEGAPKPPDNIRVTNGEAVSTKSLTIAWDAVPANTGSQIKYAVYRTSSVDSIYSLVNNNVTTNSFTDSSLLKTGLKYYYYVQTIETKDGQVLKSAFSKTGPVITNNGNESANPDAAVGWLLSPPSNCEVLDSSNNSQYIIRWTPAVGYEIVNYLYNIYYCNTLDGEPQLLVQDLQEGNPSLKLDSDGYYSIAVDKKQFYRVSTINVTESDLSQTVAPCPSAPTDVVASKTSGLDGLQNYEPNTNGVYPVQITWKAPKNENPYGYHVYRSTKPDSSFRKITDSPVTDNSFTFIDTNETARAGTMYYYKVVSLNILMQGKNSNGQSENTRGYGALTREQWFLEYNKTVKRSQAKLTLMHKDGTNALGSESINGDIRGSLSYNASMAGLGARIIMRYTDYADYYISNNPDFGIYFLLNGESNTTANMSANGTMDGTTTADVSGMYPGYTKYDNLQIKGGGAGGGTYLVSTKDKNGKTILAEGDVDWTLGEQ